MTIFRKMKKSYTLLFVILGILPFMYFLYYFHSSDEYFLNYTNSKLVTKEEQKKENNFLYEPLEDTENSWTMLDVRRRYIGPNIPYGVNNGNFEKDLTVKSVIKYTSENRTFNSNILIYNRVPKCGSTTMKQLLIKMSKKNNFKYHHSKLFWKQVLTPEEETELFDNIVKNSYSLYAFNRHFFTFDWNKFSSVEVNNMNLIRDPADRIESMFYYNRKEGRWKKQKHKPPSEWFAKNFEKCITSGDKECQIGEGGQDLQLSFFCGSHHQCSNSSNVMALQVAKYNLEHRFSVVGVLEHLNISVAALEAYMPAFFTGASKFLSSSDKTHQNSNPHAKMNSNIREILRGRLSLDYDFYEFAKQRLFAQWNSIKK